MGRVGGDVVYVSLHCPSKEVLSQDRGEADAAIPEGLSSGGRLLAPLRAQEADSNTA